MDGTLVAKCFFRRSIANDFFVVRHNGFVFGRAGGGEVNAHIHSLCVGWRNHGILKNY
jgi:hypothetical protein